MKSAKTILLVIAVIAMLLITNLLLAQDTTATDDKAIVKDDFGRSTGLTKSGLAKHKQEYEAKARKQGINRRTPLFYAARTNLNAYNELKKIGIDLVETAHKHGGEFTYKENTIDAQVVIHGKVLRREEEQYPKYHYPFKYTIIVNEVLKGGDFLETNPDTIIAVGTYIGTEVRLKENDEVILFLTKEYIRLQIEDKGVHKFPDYIFKPTTFYKFDDLIIKDDNVLPSDFLYGGGNPKNQQSIKAEAIMDTIKMIDKINKADSFYKLKF